MSEDYEEGESLSAEELFELHQAEIADRFEEKGLFARIGAMFSGLGKPKNSREYKLAVIELQRLMAPLIAILVPVLGVVALIVITAVQGQQREVIKVDVVSAVEDPDELTPDEPDPEIEPPDTPPEEVTDIVVDTPVVGPQSDMISNAPPTNEPLSVKPATQDSVAIIKSPVTMRTMTGSRNPGSIGRLTSGGANNGDASTEAAVMKALRWLKHTQESNGSWRKSPVSNTALAILAYLAHGETPASPEFGYTVQKAIEFLIDSQIEKAGFVTFKGADNHEYAVLIATYALGEAYGMTKNPNAREAAMKSMERIIQNQSPTGGWDYNMKKDSPRDDLSYAGWALQALKACKMAGLHPEGLDECIKKAIKCLKTRNFRNGGFNYTAGGVPTGLTATGCLAMQLLGYGEEDEVTQSLEFMRNWAPAFEPLGRCVPGGETPGSNPQYYCYYAAQCKYQAGMKDGASAADLKSWQTWNAQMKALYPKSIQTLDEKIEGPDGKMHAMGFWPMQESLKQGGDTMATCLCALQLMVYYRYLPTTKIEKSAAGGKASSSKKAKDDDVDIMVDI